MTSSVLVHLSGVNKTFRGNTVLDDVHLDVEPGEAVALLGANGSGKTTLLKVIATLLRPTRGSVRIAGHDAVAEVDAVRRNVGFLAHGAYVYDELTAIENLRFWSTFGGAAVPRDRLLSALTAVELDAVAHERVRTFSAGMKRRLSLARLLLAAPRVLLLDEPFTGLDRRARKWLQDHLEDVKLDGGAVVLTTHSFGLSLAVANRVMILGGGRIVVDRRRSDVTLDELARLYSLHAEDAA